MKIGFDAKRVFHNTTGLGNYSRDLIRILAKFYPKSTYYLYNPKPKKVYRLELTQSMHEVLPNTKFWKKYSSLWRQTAVLKQIKSDGVDVFHGLSGEIPRGLTKNKIKSVVTIHDLIFMRYPKLYSFFDRKIHFKKFKYAAKNANKVIAISEQTKKDIITFLKIDPSKIEVVYQGCNNVFKEERSVIEKKEFLDKYKIPDTFLLNVGTIEERKNALSIVKAVKEIDIPLVIVGRKTKYYTQIEDYIQKNNLENKIYFLEGLTLKELSIVYQLAEIFIYPSIFEGFGIPIIEALFSKTPVITSKEGVFPEAGGPDSLYVDPYNIKEMTEAIELLLNSKNKKEEMVNKGFDFAQQFNDEIIAKKIKAIYKEL
ncbi:glycosyltransferase family 1 protein [Tenacibaculum sp. E3R01]|uniref:glycosyltransferase family 4 protein n=1 Tax=Tenacibaculum sp. E3R01 TaxID=2267227 RepID=UPI000DE9AFF4|nr:glycosyltransferase family 1 protein [Tenacibaculum sp. E3R01]RBW56377.1 glycosyltransferase family 1 protein [Tenacibaculum sp. E3R01]